MPALISISVELALFPILAYYFNTVPTVVVLANVIIVPLAGLSVVLTCFTLFSAIFSISLAGLFSAANWLCLDLTLRLTRIFAGFQAAKISLPAPSVFTFVFYYLILWLLVSSLGSKRKPYLFSALILANLFFWGGAFSRSDQTLRMSILDTGSGVAAVLESPNREIFAINAGEKERNLDAGEYIVVPFLNHEGINLLDGLILTDRGAPNLTSALSVAKSKRIERLFIQHEDYLASESCFDLTERLQIKPLFFDSVGSIADPKNHFSIRFLAYPQPEGWGSDGQQVLVKVEYHDISICLLDGTKRIRFSRRFDWRQVRNCSILVLSELGNEDDVRQIISTVRPEKIVFTRYYLRYQKDKIPLLMASSFPEIEYHRTAQGGAIVCETDGEEIEVKSILP